MPVEVGPFVFKSGTITFLAAVNGTETGAVFLGQGHFILKPVMPLDTQEMIRRSGSEIAEEDFTEIVFRFSSTLAAQFSKIKKNPAEAAGSADGVFEKWRSKMRRPREDAGGFTEASLQI